LFDYKFFLDEEETTTKTQHVYTKGCCNRQCIWHFTMLQCRDYRIWFHQQPSTRQQQWLKSTICASTREGSVQFYVDGQALCHGAFKKIFGISNTRLNSALKDAANPRAEPVHGNIGNQNALHLEKRVHIRYWMEEFLTKNANFDPSTNHVHFASYITKDSLYKQFFGTLVAEDLHPTDIPSYSTFFRYIKHNFSNIKFLKNTLLGRCTFCLEIPDRMKQCTSLQEVADFKEAVRQHHLRHTTEREIYETRCRQSRAHPDRSLSLIVDCPTGFQIPQRRPATKDFQAATVPVEAVGTICHSTDERHYMFYLPVWPKGSNLIITVLFLRLFALLSDAATHGRHPPVLWLQLDNTARENKNKWMFAFLSWLVHLGWFLEVVVSFLPCGHTHVDVDQMFSTFAIWRTSNNIFNFSDTIRAIANAYPSATSKPSATFLPFVLDWKAYFAPFIQKLQNIADVHAFLIRKQPDDTVAMRFKKWHGDNSVWQGADPFKDFWVRLFPVVNGVQQFPSGTPSTILPHSIESDVTVDSLRSFLGVHANGYINEWDEFLTNQVFPENCVAPIPEDLFNFTKVCFFLHGTMKFKLFKIKIFISVSI
jgi:hypothetical protein